MRIISKFRDYYDSVQAHGQDQTTVYVRSAEQVADTSFLIADPPNFRLDQATAEIPPSVDSPHPHRIWFNFRPLRVFVAGKTYRRIAVSSTKSQYAWNSSFLHEDNSFYSFIDLDKFLIRHNLLVKDIVGRYWPIGYAQNLNNLINYLSRQGTSENEAALVSNRITVLVERWGTQGNSYFERDGSLSAVKFFTQTAPFELYQELDMYISGVLGSQAKEVINISDKDRIHQHGFDKYSFRKPPEEKKRRKSN